MARIPLMVLRDELQLTTWLWTGALLQSLAFLVYPQRITALPALLIISWRILGNLMVRWGFVRSNSYDEVRLGRTTAQILDRDGKPPKSGSDKDVVVFMLGARSNHPTEGRLSAHFPKVRDMFGDMWKDLNANREKWGYLGKTSTLLATDAEDTNTTIWISYWRSIEDLHRFARGDKHRKGWEWYSKHNPSHIGIMHETYLAPAGSWETIYHNFTPFGLGQTKQVVEKHGSMETASGLIDAKGATWQSMKARMRRAVESNDGA